MDISFQQHVLPLVIVLVMVTVGFEILWGEFVALLKRPRSTLGGTLVHTLTFPAVAVSSILLAQAWGLAVSDAVLIGILLIAACPSGGFSNVLTLIAGANLPLSVMLTFISSVLSFITVPLLMAGFGLVTETLEQPVSLPVVSTLVQLFLLVVLPVAVGMLVRVYAPVFTARHTERMQKIAQMLLYACVVGVMFENSDVMIDGLSEALPWSLVLCALNLFFCFQGAKLVGLDLEDRITVALEGCIRNLAVAFLIAITVLERPDIAVLPTVYFIAVLMAGIVFAKSWRRWLARPDVLSGDAAN